MLPYRYQEFLQAISTDPKGLSTRRLLKTCRSSPGSEMPDSIDVVSKIAYVLRNKGWISSYHAGDGNTHRITPEGLKVLREAVADEPVGENQNDPEPVAQNPPESAPIADCEIKKTDDEQMTVTKKDEDGVPIKSLLVDYYLAEAEDRFEKNHITISRKDPVGQIVELINQTLEAGKKRAIQDRDKKIEVLERIGSMMSDDIYAVLREIVNDLELE